MTREMNAQAPTVTSAHEVLDGLNGLRSRVDADRRSTSFPLVVFGLVTLGAALLPAPTHGMAPVYWLLAAPIAFTLLWSMYRRRETTVGVGTPARSYGHVAIGFAVISVLVPGLLMIFGAAAAAAGLALAIFGLRQRNRVVAATGLVFGVVVGLEHWSVLTNRVHALFAGSTTWADNAVMAALGLGLLAIGLIVYRREVETR